MNDWEQYEEARDEGVGEDTYEVIDSDMEEIEDSEMLLMAQEKNRRVDKVVRLIPEVEYSLNLDDFYREVVYCIDKKIETKTMEVTG